MGQDAYRVGYEFWAADGGWRNNAAAPSFRNGKRGCDIVLSSLPRKRDEGYFYPVNEGDEVQDSALGWEG